VSGKLQTALSGSDNLLVEIPKSTSVRVSPKESTITATHIPMKAQTDNAMCNLLLIAAELRNSPDAKAPS
jgi:hypothetical protein